MEAGLSRNRSIEAALGEYLSFVDADDNVSLAFLELLYNKAHAEYLELTKRTAVYELEALWSMKEVGVNKTRHGG